MPPAASLWKLMKWLCAEWYRPEQCRSPRPLCLVNGNATGRVKKLRPVLLVSCSNTVVQELSLWLGNCNYSALTPDPVTNHVSCHCANPHWVSSFASLPLRSFSH